MNMHKHDSVVSPCLPYKEWTRELGRWTHSSSIRRRGGGRPVDVGIVVWHVLLRISQSLIHNSSHDRTKCMSAWDD